MMVHSSKVFWYLGSLISCAVDAAKSVPRPKCGLAMECAKVCASLARLLFSMVIELTMSSRGMVSLLIVFFFFCFCFFFFSISVFTLCCFSALASFFLMAFCIAADLSFSERALVMISFMVPPTSFALASLSWSPMVFRSSRHLASSSSRAALRFFSSAWYRISDCSSASCSAKILECSSSFRRSSLRCLSSSFRFFSSSSS
mmetsp:Transcript_2457/g.5702  ORF Transcript_2457/g.5702 Transcript_2457/m.5702 type:complete len:202 (+) Transcript_2457:1921-2526(+)